MSSEVRLVLRAILVFLVSTTSYLVAVDEPFGKVAALGAINAAVIALLELLGPTSDAGVTWSKPK